jgi:hypothetical protein
MDWIIEPGTLVDTTPLKFKTTGGGMRTAKDGLTEAQKSEIRYYAQWTDSVDSVTLIFLKQHGNASNKAFEQFRPLVAEVMGK